MFGGGLDYARRDGERGSAQRGHTHALDYARAMAERFNSKLHILHVIGDPTSYIYGEASSNFLAMEKRARIKAGWEMDKYRTLLGDLPNHELIIKEGGVLNRILETIAEKHIDNVVMGSQGGGVLRNLLTGSIADKVTWPESARRSPQSNRLRCGQASGAVPYAAFADFRASSESKASRSHPVFAASRHPSRPSGARPQDVAGVLHRVMS